MPLTARDRHLLSRFSFGVTPALVRSTGGSAGAWFLRQTQPATIVDTFADGLIRWFPRIVASPGVLFERDQAEVYQGWEVSTDIQRWTMMRRTFSQRQLLEVMTDFWSNLLHISVHDDTAWPWRLRYDAMIRSHALGRFDSLLQAAITHPAMGCYLDNASSTRLTLNENLGREVLELHTVGLDAGYTETDVKSSAQMLTGYRVDVRGSYDNWYSETDHEVGLLSIMDFKDANLSSDGRASTARYLRYLAHHPATARRIARRLCVQFVSDEPSAGLVTTVATAFQLAGTAIVPTLQALIATDEFRVSVGAKVRTPTEDAIATYRAVGVKVQQPVGHESFANAVVYQTTAMGQRVFDWPAPDGFPLLNESWVGVSRMLNSWQTHHLQAGGYYPSKEATHRSAVSWLPTLPARFDVVVDHVCRQLLARPATADLQTAASIRLQMSGDQRVASQADLPTYKMTRLLGTLLDSPQHMTR
jgi:uncharacterized protein (DUF1800 family)